MNTINQMGGGANIQQDTLNSLNTPEGKIQNLKQQLAQKEAEARKIKNELRREEEAFAGQKIEAARSLVMSNDISSMGPDELDKHLEELEGILSNEQLQVHIRDENHIKKQELKHLILTKAELERKNTGAPITEMSIRTVQEKIEALQKPLQAHHAKFQEYDTIHEQAFKDQEIEQQKHNALANIIGKETDPAKSEAISVAWDENSRKLNQLRNRIITLNKILPLLAKMNLSGSN